MDPGLQYNRIVECNAITTKTHWNSVASLTTVGEEEPWYISVSRPRHPLKDGVLSDKGIQISTFSKWHFKQLAKQFSFPPKQGCWACTDSTTKPFHIPTDLIQKICTSTFTKIMKCISPSEEICFKCQGDNGEANREEKHLTVTPKDCNQH